jgi:nitroreductase
MNVRFFPLALLLSVLLFSSHAIKSIFSSNKLSKQIEQQISLQAGSFDAAHYMNDLLEKRYSGRLYDASRVVSQDDVRAIVYAGGLAPSSYNEQPWRFIVCDKNVNPQAYAKVLSSLVEFNQGWAQHAPVLIVVISRLTSNYYEKGNHWAHYDTGAAAVCMMLKATSLNLMTHQMGGFDAAKITDLFQISEDFMPMAVMAVGYAAPADKKAPQKERKPIEEICFFGDWHN